MNRLLGKLRFVHQHLWHQDGLYRAALLFGPAPLLGCLLAGVAWWALHEVSGNSKPPLPPWGTPQAVRPARNAETGTPQTLQPFRPLPPVGAGGVPSGYEPGWRVTVNPVEVSPTMVGSVNPNPISGFLLNAPSVDMAQVVGKEPSASPFAVVGSGLLVVRTAGLYVLTVRFQRPAGSVAECITQLSLGPRRIVSELGVNMVNDIARTFEAPRFDLVPGLYQTGWAFGCWHDKQEAGSGRWTIMLAHPGETTLLPMRSDDIVRPARDARP